LKGYVLFKILTKGIYTTFTRAVKEAVSNAYDANANNVQIIFDPPTFLTEQDQAELTVQIYDDGNGMSLDDFWDKFASIESQKDPTKKDPKTGRYPIGQFGIGSFALVPFSRTLTLYSKKYNSLPIKCVIHAENLQEETADDYADHVRKNIEDKEITDEEWETVSDSTDSGTVIEIQGVTDETYSELVDGVGRFEDGGKSLFTDAPYTTGLKEIAWELSTLLPLTYGEDPGSVAEKHKSALKSHNKGIHIELSEVELKRQIYSSADCFTQPFNYNHDGVTARGVLVARHQGPVEPRDANGVMLRLNNVGIGTYQLFGLVGQATIRQRLTGEVHILHGLHDALNNARDRFTGPAYDQLKAKLLAALQELASEAETHWKERGQKKHEKRQESLRQKHKEAYKKHQKRKQNPTTSKQSDSEERSDRTAKKKSETSTRGGAGATQPSEPEQQHGEPDTESPRPFTDPVVNVRHGAGDITFDDSHDLFKVYRGTKEMETMKAVLRAMKIAAVPKDVYERVIETLLSFR
jgi:hypothetical protein